MEKMNDLHDLLKHEIQDLYSVEEQIIKAMPAMIQKANSWDLKKALEEHLNITKKQLTRLDQAQKIVNEDTAEVVTEKKQGLLSRLFKRSQVCKGMQGIIEEGEKVMAEEMSPEVLDAAIIACAQKIEHYEICGYGTARAYARELNLTQLAGLLEQTLDEEYEADDRLTRLAVDRLNKKAEKGSDTKVQAAVGKRESIGANERATARRVEESELELVNQKNTSTTGIKKPSRSRSAAPKGADPERSEHSSRSAASKRTTSASNTKSTGKSSGRSENKSTGRGNITRSGSSREQ